MGISISQISVKIIVANLIENAKLLKITCTGLGLTNPDNSKFNSSLQADNVQETKTKLVYSGATLPS